MVVIDSIASRSGVRCACATSCSTADRMRPDSTATISRLLQRARAEGIVRIEVLDLATPEDITRQLVQGLKLRDAAVVETPAAGTLAALAAPLGGLLRRARIVAGSVVAIGWGRAVREVIRAGLPRMPGVLTVLTGADYFADGRGPMTYSPAARHPPTRVEGGRIEKPRKKMPLSRRSAQRFCS